MMELAIMLILTTMATEFLIPMMTSHLMLLRLLIPITTELVIILTTTMTVMVF